MNVVLKMKNLIPNGIVKKIENSKVNRIRMNNIAGSNPLSPAMSRKVLWTPILISFKT